MKFFFPDAHDLVDPSFDFETEKKRSLGSRQQEHLYAHEVLEVAPYDGMLLSKAMIDPHSPSRSVRYSFAQVQRLKRNGAREFLRLNRPQHLGIMTMGDCGSFSYVNEPEPPFGVESVIEFYLDCQFDFGISLDHVILGFRNGLDDRSLPVPEDWKKRFDITLDRAKNFFCIHSQEKLPFVPIGVAQGWSPSSYKLAVEALQRMGYKYIALGGMVPLKTREILETLEEVNNVRASETKLHLLGISRLENIESFSKYGVYSIDSTSPLKKAFMDSRDNYHTADRTFTAIRIPQVDGNPQLKKLILSGRVQFEEARRLEKSCFDAAIGFEKGNVEIEKFIDLLREYENLWNDGYDNSDRYRDTLLNQPWKTCPCSVCKAIGIHVVLFRGAERNRRRGFHNLYVLRSRINQSLA